MLHNASWKTVRLESITSKIGSGATPRGGKESYQHTGISLIRSLNVYDFCFVKDGLAHIDEDQAEQLAGVTVETDDILLNITGASVARCCMVPQEVLPARVNQHVAIVRVKEDIADPAFVFYCLNSPRYKSQLLALAQGGATREALTKETIENFQVSLPARPVQQRLSSILRAYDHLIENNTRRIKVLEEMAQLIYWEWFVNFRFPGHDKLRMVQQADVGPLPAGWTTVPLENVCVRITDGSHWSPTTIASTHRMASSKDMRRWELDLSECRTISKEDYDSLVRNDCRPLAGDVLITKDGANYLKHCFAVEKNLDVVLLSSIAMLRPREQVLSNYLSFYLRDPAVKARLSGRVSGVAIPRIILTDFRHFTIMLPDPAIVREFHNVVDPIVKVCRRLTECNQNLRQTRDLLLPKLISGEASVEQFEAEAVAQGV